MLQVNPVNRPDIKEVLTGLEAIAIAMDVDLKGKVVSYITSHETKEKEYILVVEDAVYPRGLPYKNDGGIAWPKLIFSPKR